MNCKGIQNLSHLMYMRQVPEKYRLEERRDSVNISLKRNCSVQAIAQGSPTYAKNSLTTDNLNTMPAILFLLECRQNNDETKGQIPKKSAKV